MPSPTVSDRMPLLRLFQFYIQTQYGAEPRFCGALTAEDAKRLAKAKAYSEGHPLAVGTAFLDLGEVDAIRMRDSIIPRKILTLQEILAALCLCFAQNKQKSQENAIALAALDAQVFLVRRELRNQRRF